MMHEKKFLIAFGLVLAIVLVFVFLQSTKNPVENPQTALEPKKEKLTELEIERTQYGFPVAVFEWLPKPPKDFAAITGLLHSGKYANYLFFSEKYFLQPEFYPGFKENAFSYWLHPDPNRHNVFGYGFYPPFQQVQAKAGETVQTAFFMQSGWGVQTNQGTRMELKGQIEGITASIKEPEFLLEHSFPKFSKNWAKKIEVQVSVEKNVLPGTYRLEFFPTPPSNESRQKWLKETNRQYYDAASYGFGVHAAIEVKVN